jgi:hypothetical protein
MTLTFESDKDVIVYALEKIIAEARRKQQIFVAQCVWWLTSIIRLEQGLANYIGNIQSRLNVTIIPEKAPSVGRTVSTTPRDNQQDQRRDQVLKECEECLRDSREQRDIADLRASGRTKTGRINPLKSTKDSLKVSKKASRTNHRKSCPERSISKVEGIALVEVKRRREAGQCVRCAWPSDRKGSHRVKDCVRSITLEKGTACYPKAKEYQRLKQIHQQPLVEEVSSDNVSSGESSDDSL